MALAIYKNGNDGECLMYILGFCSDNNLSDHGFPGDQNFTEILFPATSPGASQPCIKFQQLVSSTTCFVSLNGLTSGDALQLPTASGGYVSVQMNQIGGVVQEFPGSHGTYTKFIGVGVDVTLCGGNGYWTRGPNNSQIDLPGPVLMYHELVGHALHKCQGTEASDYETQAINEENVLRTHLGLPQRTAHQGGCWTGGGGSGGGCVIATAAYGGTIAPEVHELRQFRDGVLRGSRWGAAFFDEFWSYYYSFSPRVAEMMEMDPRMSDYIRAGLVHPLIVALRLFLALPDDPEAPAASVEFAKRAEEEFSHLVEQLPLAGTAPRDDPELLKDELVSVLGLLGNPRLRKALLDNLTRSGILPLTLPEDARRLARTRLEAAGLSRSEVRQVLSDGRQSEKAE